MVCRMHSNGRCLEPWRAQLPPELFSQPYQPHKTDGSGYDRASLLTAFDLLKQGGLAD